MQTSVLTQQMREREREKERERERMKEKREGTGSKQLKGFKQIWHLLTIASRQFDIRLIPVFSGAATETPITEWLEDLELTCKFCELVKLERILPL